MGGFAVVHSVGLEDAWERPKYSTLLQANSVIAQSLRISGQSASPSLDQFRVAAGRGFAKLSYVGNSARNGSIYRIQGC